MVSDIIIIVVAIEILLTAFSIHVGAIVVVDVNDYLYAIMTTVLATFVLEGTIVLFGWIPLLGAILPALCWNAVINWHYPGSWVDAIAINHVAGIVSQVVVWVLCVFQIELIHGLSIPGA